MKPTPDQKKAASRCAVKGCGSRRPLGHPCCREHRELLPRRKR